MADLAGVAGPARQERPLDHDPRSHAGIAGYVNDMPKADGDTPGTLGQRPEVRLVGQQHARTAGKLARQEAAERHIVPEKVGSEVYEAVAAPNDPRHGDGRADQLPPGRRPAHELPAQTADSGHGRGRGQAFGPVPALCQALVDLSSGAHPRHDERIDAEFDRKHPDPLAREAHEQGRAPGHGHGPSPGGQSAFRHQAHRRQLADQGADRAPVEPGTRGQLGTGERPGQVQVTHKRSQVVAPQVLVDGRLLPRPET